MASSRKRGGRRGDDIARSEAESDEESEVTSETDDLESDPLIVDAEVIDEVDEEESIVAVEKKLTGRKSSDERLNLIKRDPLSAYVQETKRYPLLSREEEHAFAVSWVEDGDADAARTLIESNLRLVVKIAYEYRRAHRNLLDLVQEGNIGLMQAVKKYDPYRGVKLSSYAAWWIRAYILKFILNNWRLVKIGTTQAQRKLFFNLKKERDRLESLGFDPDAKMLAESLDVREKDVVEMQKRLAAPEASFDAPIGADGESGTRYDFVASSDEQPDVLVEKGQFAELLKAKLEIFGKDLKDREETIFRERWLSDTPMTLQKIGTQYGVSRERARQVEKRLMGRLRKFLEAELGSAVELDSFGGD